MSRTTGPPKTPGQKKLTTVYNRVLVFARQMDRASADGTGGDAVREVVRRALEFALERAIAQTRTSMANSDVAAALRANLERGGHR